MSPVVPNLSLPSAVLRVLVLALGVIATAGCSTGPSTSPSAKEATASSHRADTRKLEVVMRGFDEAVRKHVPEETDVYDRWEGVYAGIADAAEQLEESAKQLSGHPPRGLELPDRGRFQVMARTLGERAAALRATAATNDPEAIAAAREDLAVACRDCHSRYRKDAPDIPDAFR